ncbi:MAG: class I SAM-dependent methyltransferase [Dysgonamonadaceae bacterium]|nr:class I SAM-dependent methyltransferase [Dysgonamonadaceae bacterium]
MKFTSSIKLYRKLRYRKGFGVHSPFIYNLITKVIEENIPYYVFDEIEHFRKGLALRKETQHKNYGALLFRVIHFFKCRTILQIRAYTGVLTLYLSLASRKNSACYALEEHSDWLDAVKVFAGQHRLENLHWMEGDYADNLRKLKAIIPTFDLIFINRLGNAKQTAETVELTRSFIGEKSILIIDGIYKNKAMRTLWEKVKHFPETSVTIDLFALGIIFFDKKLHKQHYKNYFDYGKKQNLYEKRRQRLYLFGWRKKDTQNESET